MWCGGIEAIGAEHVAFKPKRGSGKQANEAAVLIGMKRAHRQCRSAADQLLVHFGSIPAEFFLTCNEMEDVIRVLRQGGAGAELYAQRF